MPKNTNAPRPSGRDEHDQAPAIVAHASDLSAVDSSRLGGATLDDMERVLDQCKRKNGTLKVSLMERYTRWLIERAGRAEQSR